MSPTHPALGLLLLALTLGFLFRIYRRAKPQNAMPVAGKFGLALITFSEVLLFLKIHWITIYFTPLAWTGYILVMDSLVFSVQGSSLLQTHRGRFCALSLCSAPLWLIFEAYNFRLRNWAYIGLPHRWFSRDAGYLWAFSTIWPAIFETADFLIAASLFPQQAAAHKPAGGATLCTLSVTGILCLAVPVVLPPLLGAYLFGLVWVGFVLLLDPLNYVLGGRSLLRDWEAGDLRISKAFLASGMICGIFWEFWNYWAHARWIYIFPILQNWKIFEMPVPGFLGFPPFAAECFVMFEFLRSIHRLLKSSPRPKAFAASANPSR
jgi:hypothetical protein